MANMNDYRTAQAYPTPPEAQLPFYQPQHYSPVNSASASPMNLSPTSPRNPSMLPQLPLATRQLRPPKSPMYVPAVLRPTERPHRPSPLTPPRSMHGSTDSLDENQIPIPPSRQSTSDSKDKTMPGQGCEEERVTEEEEERHVTGQPTRSHWKPDGNATICEAPVCQKSFTLFERRHHCRHCGDVFCNSHSHYTVPLDQDAEFHSQGTESRACKHCWEKYKQWCQFRSSRQNSISSATTTTPSTPVMGVAKGRDVAQGGSEAPKSPLAQSLSRDWNWSTF